MSKYNLKDIIYALSVGSIKTGMQIEAVSKELNIQAQFHKISKNQDIHAFKYENIYFYAKNKILICIEINLEGQNRLINSSEFTKLSIDKWLDLAQKLGLKHKSILNITTFYNEKISINLDENLEVGVVQLL